MNKANIFPIYPACEICGKPASALSEIRLSFRYGSDYDTFPDMTDLTLSVCGTCIDSIYRFIQRQADNATAHNNHNRQQGSTG